MKKIKSLFTISLVMAGIVAVIAGCDKNKPYDLILAEPQVHFAGSSFQSYIMTTNPAAVYKVVVGTTDVASSDRTFTFKVTSPTGAVAGTHYSIVGGGNTVTVPAGKATADINVQGVYSLYTTGRKDTLVFTLSEPSGSPIAKFSDTVKLRMRGPCFEGEINTDFATLAGAYNARENGYNANGSAAYTDYGPYASTVSNVTSISATTADITVNHLYEVTGWQAKFRVDWTNLADRRITVASQLLGPSTAIGIAGYNVYAEPADVAQNPPPYGTFAFCTPSITIKFRLGLYSTTTGLLAGYLSAATGGGIATFTMVLTK